MTKETFFIQVPPGLEDLAKTELILKLNHLTSETPQISLDKGGLLLELPIEVGVALNYWLKIPNRILLRLTSFKCRDLPKLFNKVSKLPLQSFIAGQDFNYQISSSQSRLFDSRKIEKTLRDALASNLKRQAPKKKAQEQATKHKTWHFYCRFQDDTCELSIDTTGERLGKRGEKVQVGTAPLRENLACALYFATIQQLPSEDLKKIYEDKKDQLIVDPYAGSGTILCEAHNFFKPSIKRKYSFQFFPVFLNKQELITAQGEQSSSNKIFLVAGENSVQQFEALKENLDSTDNNNIYLSHADSFQGELKSIISTIDKAPTLSFTITNPPYGKRVASLYRPKLEQLLTQIFELHPFDLVGILMPKEYYSSQKKFKLILKLPFSHGGLDVSYSIWKRTT